MDMLKIPTTADIYLEVDGKRLAVVQSYRVTTTRESRTVEAFGQAEPVTTIRGLNRYVLELSRLYATDEAIRDGVDFASLEGFSIVICKPDRSQVYYDCQWSELMESAEVGGMVLERVTVLAGRRVEIAV